MKPAEATGKYVVVVTYPDNEIRTFGPHATIYAAEKEKIYLLRNIDGALAQIKHLEALAEWH